MDPELTYIGPQVSIGQDTVIYPNVYLEGKSQIGEDCVIEPNVKIPDSLLGDKVTVKMGSVITESRLAQGAQVGPYSHLRPLSDLREGAKVGNFVEVKKSILHPGVKANHLTYLGDAEVGAGANVGAVTITCNYDGMHKHKTVIEEGAFIGSNTSLVAPVSIGASAYVGAGSTITKDVPPGKLGISRAKQVIIERRLIGKKPTPPESELLSGKNLPGLLADLGLSCSHVEIEECLTLLVSPSRRNISRVAAPGAVSRPSMATIRPLAKRMRRKEPPPMPELAPSTTPRVSPTATAASMALPPPLSTFSPASVARGCTEATMPCLQRLVSAQAGRDATRKENARARAGA